MTLEWTYQIAHNVNALKKVRNLMAFSPGSKGHSVLELISYMGTEIELDLDVRARNLIIDIHSFSTKEKANQAIFAIF